MRMRDGEHGCDPGGVGRTNDHVRQPRDAALVRGVEATLRIGRDRIVPGRGREFALHTTVCNASGRPGKARAFTLVGLEA